MSDRIMKAIGHILIAASAVIMFGAIGYLIERIVS